MLPGLVLKVSSAIAECDVVVVRLAALAASLAGLPLLPPTVTLEPNVEEMPRDVLGLQLLEPAPELGQENLEAGHVQPEDRDRDREGRHLELSASSDGLRDVLEAVLEVKADLFLAEVVRVYGEVAEKVQAVREHLLVFDDFRVRQLPFTFNIPLT